MNNTCPTVRVKVDVTTDNPEGFVVINECDLTANHDILDDEEAAPAEPLGADAPASEKPAGAAPWLIPAKS